MKKLYYLEGLRGYMSLWVFFTHALTMATFPFQKEVGIGKLLVNGYWPVCIFVVLSGFVTHLLLEKEEPYKKLPNMLYLFGIGYLTYQFYKYELANNKKNITVIFLGVLVFFLLYFDVKLALITILWMMTLYFQMNPNKLSDIILENKAILFVGKISYSLYCVHMIVLTLCVYLLINVFSVSNQNMYRFGLLALSLPLSLVISHFTYTYIELPFINYAKKK